MRPELITQIIRKLLFCATDVRAIGKRIPISERNQLS